jgi:hypothetical protein
MTIELVSTHPLDLDAAHSTGISTRSSIDCIVAMTTEAA